MVTYLKMKRNEWKLKTMAYSAIISLIDNQKGISDFIKKMYISLKDVPADELQEEFISRLAEIIHEENKKDE